MDGRIKKYLERGVVMMIKKREYTLDFLIKMFFTFKNTNLKFICAAILILIIIIKLQSKLKIEKIKCEYNI